ncbi:NUDIX domain-containing protein [Candidatus Parcubacteria bacterium]|nr:MAG: NUDIX domain-containing protein [Candidatus Parcubacteria bacterium]
MQKPKFKNCHHDLVDENDHVIGKTTFKEIVEKNLFHRLACAIVTNSKGEILMQKRAPWLYTKPGMWETRIGGHVEAGETYGKAAIRELREEMGIKIKPQELKFILKGGKNNKRHKYFRKYYTCIYDGKIKIDPKEVSAYKWVDINKVRQFAGKKLSPGAKRGLKIYKQWRKKMTPKVSS